MYHTSYFKEADKAAVLEFIQLNPFAIVTGFGSQFPAATHIPLLIEEKDNKLLFYGHIMRKTDHHLAFEKNNKVLVIFNGPHTQISAGWYTTPAIGSTWNYMTVHAKGMIRFVKEDKETIAILKKLTDKYEGLEAASSFTKLPEEYINQNVKAIIGFTIEVESIDNVFKLSQNRDEDSKRNIIKELRKRGDWNSAEIAREIEKRL